MVNITVNVCRLCLKAAEDSDVINCSDRDTIQIVIPQVDLDIGNNHRTCKNCAKLLKQLFDFKSKCLEIEDGIHDFKNEGHIPIDLEKSLGINEVKKSLRICRTCSEYLKNNAYVDLNSRNGLQCIFKKCLPEMDIKLTVEPVICLRCQGLLKKLFNFITSCEKNEEKLRFLFEKSNKNWKLTWCNIVQYEQNQVLDTNRILNSTNIKQSISNSKLDIAHIKVRNKDLKNLNVISNNWSDVQLNNFTMGITEENEHNIKATKTPTKRKSRGNKIKPNYPTRVTNGDNTSKDSAEHSWVSIEKENCENIVLNDISYFSTRNTYTEDRNIFYSEPDSMSKKIGKDLEHLKNTSKTGDNRVVQVLETQNIFPSRNLTDTAKETKVPNAFLGDNINNEIYIVPDSDKDDHNIKATEKSYKRKTRGNKIKQTNLNKVTDEDISSNYSSDSSWVDSGNLTDSSGEWFSTPKKSKRAKKQKSVEPTKPIQHKDSVFCKYCFFSTTSTQAIKRHISTCPRNPFLKNLTKTSVEKNGTSLQKNNAEETVGGTRSYESIIQKDFLSSTLNYKGIKQNGHQFNSNILESILTNSNKQVEDSLATKGTSIEPKPYTLTTRRTSRKEDQIKKPAINIDKKQPRDGPNLTTEESLNNLEPFIINVKGTSEEQDQTNKNFNIVKDTAGIVKAKISSCESAERNL